MSSTDTRVNVTPQATVAHSVESSARARAVWCASLFLVLSGLVLASNATSRWLAVGNAALLAMLIWSLHGNSRVARFIGDLSPIVIATAVAYGEVPALVTALGSAYRDSMVQGWEGAIFGTQPSQTMAGALPNIWVSEILHGGYMAFYFATFVPPLLLYLRGNRRGLAETVLTLTATWTVCCAFFAFFPVQGPRYLWPAPPGLPEGPLRRLSMAILAAGSAKGAAFPSLHMAASVSQTFMAWRWQSRPVAIAITVVTILVGIGAVYGGYHYGVDMIAGVFVGLLVAGSVIRLAHSSRAVEDA